MSYTRKVELWCDGDGCIMRFTSSAPTVMSSRYRARLNGWFWVNENGKMIDLCPRCAEKRRETRK